VIGLLIFQYYQLNQPELENKVDETLSIDVTRHQIEQLSAHYQRINMRPPSTQELNRLIEHYIEEEVMYREALAMNLDENDAQIRRRLKMKLEYLLEDISTIEITDEILRSFLEKNVEQYRTDAYFSFQHILIKPKKHQNAKATAMQVLIQVQQGIESTTLGDVTMMQKYYKNVSESQLNVTLGREFTEQLRQLSLGEWTGPITSEYGYHIIKLRSHILAKIPSLDEVRFEVKRDFMVKRKQHNKEKIYHVLRNKYQVTITPFPELTVIH
jgi:parvulin-like peptidyl-prolyl isomerase